jgi:hypothetical protein
MGEATPVEGEHSLLLTPREFGHRSADPGRDLGGSDLFVGPWRLVGVLGRHWADHWPTQHASGGIEADARVPRTETLGRP